MTPERSSARPTTKQPRASRTKRVPTKGFSPTPSEKAAQQADLRMLIAQRAYQLYADRGYRHGHALEDWLEAEREILSHELPT